jgi:hypothetical protein
MLLFGGRASGTKSALSFHDIQYYPVLTILPKFKLLTEVKFASAIKSLLELREVERFQNIDSGWCLV